MVSVLCAVLLLNHGSMKAEEQEVCFVKSKTNIQGFIQCPCLTFRDISALWLYTVSRGKYKYLNTARVTSLRTAHWLGEIPQALAVWRGSMVYTGSCRAGAKLNTVRWSQAVVGGVIFN